MVNHKYWDFYSRFYNPLLKIAEKERAALYRNLALNPQSPLNVYVAGCGTGLDFAFLPPGSRVSAVDFSAEMLAKAKKAADKADFAAVHLQQARAECSGLADGSQDLVLLHLILAVTDQPQALLNEAVRVLNPGGLISLWDKFLPDGVQPSLMRRLFNFFTTKIATSINLHIEPLLVDLPVQIIYREFRMARLMQHMVLEKKREVL